MNVLNLLTMLLPSNSKASQWASNNMDKIESAWKAANTYSHDLSGIRKMLSDRGKNVNDLVNVLNSSQAQTLANMIPNGHKLLSYGRSVVNQLQKGSVVETTCNSDSIIEVDELNKRLKALR